MTNLNNSFAIKILDTMMKKAIDTILGIFLLILLIYIGYYFIFMWIPSNTSIAIPLLTASIGLVGIIYAQYQSKSRDISESHRSSKIETYRMFFNVVNLFMSRAKNNIEIDINDEEIQKMMQDLNENLILWASDEVLVAWKEFRNNSDLIEQEYSHLYKIDNIYRAIRKDLGHKDNKLEALDLIKMNLSDPESLDQK